MSTDFSIRPVGAPVPTPVLQPPSPAASKAVATELPRSQTVAVADASANVRNDPAPVSDGTARQVLVDRASATIVYQVVDTRTNQVVQQFPDEGVVRRRAYFRALDINKPAPTRELVTDRKA